MVNLNRAEPRIQIQVRFWSEFNRKQKFDNGDDELHRLYACNLLGFTHKLKKIRARKNESTRSNKSNVRLIKSWCEGCCIPNDINTHNNNNNARILGSYIKHQYLEYQLYIFQLCKLFTSYYYYSRKKTETTKYFNHYALPSPHIL